MKKIAIILSGCGNKDGTEITEAVSLIVGLSEAGAQIQYFAPNIEITPKNFLNNEPLAQKRNIMLESARISRSQIQDLEKLRAEDFAGLALPGGYGAALHLCTWAEQGAQCKVLPAVEKIVESFHRQGKPIAAICIAPVILAKVLGSRGITLTIGNDNETSSELQKTGAIHKYCPVTGSVTDRTHKIVTTPAYMYGDAKPHEVFHGITSLVKEFMMMA